MGDLQPLRASLEVAGGLGTVCMAPKQCQRPCMAFLSMQPRRGQGVGPGGGADWCPVPRSPPRPSPGGLHYSDEDLCNKYNGAALTESTALQEKPGDATESEVGARPPAAGSWGGALPSPGGPALVSTVSPHTHRLVAGRARTEGAPSQTGRVHARLWCARPPPRSVPGPEWTLGLQTSLLQSALR